MAYRLSVDEGVNRTMALEFTSELHDPAPYVILTGVNQENPNPLNYAGPGTNSPGVEILSDGSDGVFHCRITPYFRIQLRMRDIFSFFRSTVGMFLLSVMATMIAFNIFQKPFRSSPVNYIFSAVCITITLMVTARILLLGRRRATPKIVDIIADETQLIIRGVSQEPDVYLQENILDFRIIPTHDFFEIYAKWMIRIITKNERMFIHTMVNPPRFSHRDIVKLVRLIKKMLKCPVPLFEEQ